MSHQVVTCTIVYAMNRHIRFRVSFSLHHFSSLHTMIQSVKKNRLHKIVSIWRKQVVITLISFSLPQWNKDFWTPLEWANISFYHWNQEQCVEKFYKILFEMQNILPIVMNGLYCKFRLARLCQVYRSGHTY